MNKKPIRLLIVDSREGAFEHLGGLLSEEAFVATYVQGSAELDAGNVAQQFDLVLAVASAFLSTSAEIRASLPPTLIIANADNATLALQAVELGAADYILAPFDADLLLRRLTTCQKDHVKTFDVLNRDLHIAHQIQQSFLPEKLPQPDGWSISANFHPALSVAGDFYDAFHLTNGKRVGFVIADVCGKGLGAAIFMSLVRSLIRAFAQQHYSLNWAGVLERSDASGFTQPLPSAGTTALKKAVEMTNHFILENHSHTDLPMFATLFFGIVDPATGWVTYINGGHNPPAIIGPDGIKAELMPSGPAVGMLPNIDYQTQRVRLEPGDMLYTYTDGVTDARSPSGEHFGKARLLEILNEGCSSAESLLSRVENSLMKHIDNANQFDDITMLGLRYLPK